MKRIIYKIFTHFGLFCQKNEYWVHIKDIEIDKLMDKRISEMEYHYELSYWMEHGEFRTHIILDKNFVLKKGYINYLIAEEYGVKLIPVFFEN